MRTRFSSESKPDIAKHLPFGLYLALRPFVRYLHEKRRSILDPVLEISVFAFYSAVKSISAHALSRIPLPAVRQASTRLFQIDRLMSKSPKYVIDISKVKWRLDVTSLKAGKTTIASDTRNLHRGNLVIKGGWTKSRQHPLKTHPSAPASKSDYRHNTHETIRIMFFENRPWHETPEYFEFKAQLEAGKTPYDLRSHEDLQLRGSKLKKLHRNMQEEGYKQSQEIKGGNYWDEAHIYIDAEGDLCFGRHANHRIAIARALGIRQVPVLLGGIHIDFANQLGDPRELKERVDAYIKGKSTQ